MTSKPDAPELTTPYALAMNAARVRGPTSSRSLIIFLRKLLAHLRTHAHEAVAHEVALGALALHRVVASATCA